MSTSEGPRRLRGYHDVAHDTGSGVLEQVVAQRERLRRRLADVGCLVAVASGKGGVGKSAVSANLAALLADMGHATGAVDADLNGPSLGRMLGAAGVTLRVDGDGVHPAVGNAGARVVSMDFLQEGDAPLRWRGPGGDDFMWRGVAETGTLREFLADVAWGTLDQLLVDVPPGTDRIQRLLELVPRPHLTLLVTTPSEAARQVVARSARLLREAGVPRVGLVVNMASFHPAGEAPRPLFAADAATRLAADTGLEVWAEIPFDPELAALTDAGVAYALARPEAPAARALHALAVRVAALEDA
ncbi:MAG: P-loop NTPase [Gemmatimonadota bacterium]